LRRWRCVGSADTREGKIDGSELAREYRARLTDHPVEQMVRYLKC
jgi:hypothetical protein